MAPNGNGTNPKPVPWEIWLLAAAGFCGGGFFTFTGVDLNDKSVPDLNDLLPWWVPAGLFATLAFLGFLTVVARFSSSKKERKRFGHVVGIVQPLTGSLTAGAGLGVAVGWSIASVLQTQQIELLYVVLVPLLAICFALGLALLAPGVWLKKWFRRLNP
jgi:hypothetical protein